MNNTPKALCAETPEGAIHYTLTRKRVRNLNLRVNTDGSIQVSAPARVPQYEVNRWVASKAAWIRKTQQKVAARQAPAAPCRYTKEECLAIFAPYMERTFPLFAGILKGRPPILKVRDMKTRWGVCNTQTHTITLNMRLAEKPPDLIEYVVLHEYVHFLHPNHQAPFHAEMARLMPDYLERRKRLRG